MRPVSQSQKQVSEAVDIAHAILNGSLSVLEGARRMADVHLYSGHVRQPIDEDYSLFLGIWSATDHLPLGDVRSHWSAEALAKKDVEIQEAEALFRERALQAARALIGRYDERA